MTYKYGTEVNYVEEIIDISKKDYLKEFDWKNDEINNHIKKFQSHISTERLWGIFDCNLDKLVCVYSLKASAITRESSDNRGAAYDSAVEIAIFAVDKNYQDLRMSDKKEDGCLSSRILCSVMKKIMVMNSNICAVEYIILYSTKDAEEFYKKCKFKSFTQYMKNRDSYIQYCVPMYFPICLLQQEE